MKDFRYFEKIMTRNFKKIVTSGIDLGKYELNLKKFIRYVDEDFQTQLDLYKDVIDIDNIVLERIINAKYKFLLKGQDLRDAASFIENLVSRLDEFKGNENTLKVLIGFYSLYYLIIVKLVDIYLGAMVSYEMSGTGTVNLDLNALGVDGSVLKYYTLIEDIREKSIDEWLNVTYTDAEERYISSAIKRIMMIFGY